MRHAREMLAKGNGALLAAGLSGKGLSNGNPFALDVAGRFSSDLAREFFAESDLVTGAGEQWRLRRRVTQIPCDRRQPR
jgi:acetolactate synthase I/II/III large subunit